MVDFNLPSSQRTLSDWEILNTAQNSEPTYIYNTAQSSEPTYIYNTDQSSEPTYIYNMLTFRDIWIKEGVEQTAGSVDLIFINEEHIVEHIRLGRYRNSDGLLILIHYSRPVVEIRRERHIAVQDASGNTSHREMEKPVVDRTNGLWSRLFSFTTALRILYQTKHN